MSTSRKRREERATPMHTGPPHPGGIIRETKPRDAETMPATILPDSRFPVTTTDARSGFADLINRVVYSDKEIITRHGWPRLCSCSSSERAGFEAPAEWQAAYFMNPSCARC